MKTSIRPFPPARNWYFPIRLERGFSIPTLAVCVMLSSAGAGWSDPFTSSEAFARTAFCSTGACVDNLQTVDGFTSADAVTTLADAHVSTNYGLNRASAEALGNSNQAGADADSLWHDDLTVLGTDGQTGSGSFTFLLDGTLENGAIVQFNVDKQGGGTPGASVAFQSEAPKDTLTTVDQQIVLNYDFQYNVPFSLQADLSILVGNNDPGRLWIGNFSNTAILSAVNLPDGAVLQSASGTIYPIGESAPPGPAVPEAQGMIWVAAGASLILRIRRRVEVRS